MKFFSRFVFSLGGEMRGGGFLSARDSKGYGEYVPKPIRSCVTSWFICEIFEKICAPDKHFCSLEDHVY